MPRLAPRQGQSNFVNIVSQLSPLLHLNLTLNLQALSPLFSWLMVESHWHLLKQVVLLGQNWLPLSLKIVFSASFSLPLMSFVIFTVCFGCLLLDHYLSLYSSELGIVVLLQFD